MCAVSLRGHREEGTGVYARDCIAWSLSNLRGATEERCSFRSAEDCQVDHICMEPVCVRRQSKISSDATNVWHLKYSTSEYLPNRNRLTDIEHRHVVAKREDGWGRKVMGVWD